MFGSSRIALRKHAYAICSVLKAVKLIFLYEKVDIFLINAQNIDEYPQSMF